MMRKVLIHGFRFWLLRKTRGGLLFSAAETDEVIYLGWSDFADLYSTGLLIIDPSERVHPVEGER
jgi:hypothetical protein